VLARHPALLAFAVSFALGVAFLLLGAPGPTLLIQMLDFVFFGFGWVGVLVLAAGWIASRFSVPIGGPAQILGAGWIGFPVGFLLVGYATCAFCLID
jgi:hypothetical protein